MPGGTPTIWGGLLIVTGRLESDPSPEPPPPHRCEQAEGQDQGDLLPHKRFTPNHTSRRRKPGGCRENGPGVSGSKDGTATMPDGMTTTYRHWQPRYPGPSSAGPEALRPRLSAGLPLNRLCLVFDNGNHRDNIGTPEMSGRSDFRRRTRQRQPQRDSRALPNAAGHIHPSAQRFDIFTNLIGADPHTLCCPWCYRRV